MSKMISYDTSQSTFEFRPFETELIDAAIKKIEIRDNNLAINSNHYGYFDDGLDFLEGMKRNPNFSAQMKEEVMLHLLREPRDSSLKKEYNYAKGHILNHYSKIRVMRGVHAIRKDIWLEVIHEHMRKASLCETEIQDIYYPLWLEKAMTEKECLGLFNYLFDVGGIRSKHEIIHNIVSEGYLETKLWKGILNKALQDSKSLTLAEVSVLVHQLDIQDDTFVRVILGISDPIAFRKQMGEEFGKTLMNAAVNGLIEDAEFIVRRLRGMSDSWMEAIPISGLFAALSVISSDYGRNRIIRSICKFDNLSVEHVQKLMALPNDEVSSILLRIHTNESPQSNMVLESLVAQL